MGERSCIVKGEVLGCGVLRRCLDVHVSSAVEGSG